MERATTSFPTPVSPRISTFALLRAAMSMLRRKAIVVSLLPSSTADPRTGFSIDRIVFASGGVAERTDALNGAFVRAHHLRFEMSRIVHAKKRDLTGGGHLASRCDCCGSSGSSLQKRNYRRPSRLFACSSGRVWPVHLCTIFLRSGAYLVLAGVFRGVQGPVRAREKYVRGCGAMP